ncbi:MAG: nuclear transport factor 2 family protein [Alphaproteobacteria bacterium]|nr:MAG: nuclear transport factor 2 family protein [Alphaproteobacteria bacterium]
MDELQEMLEHYRITRLINEYCHGCDRLDGEHMASVYDQESRDDHGLKRMDGRGFAWASMEGRAQDNNLMSHHLNQTMIKVDGDTAGAETYFIAIVGYVDDDGERVVDQLGGRYVDELIRVDGQWRIKKRLTVRDWSVTVPVVKDRMAGMTFIQGQPNQSDPSYAVLGKRHSGKPELKFVPTPNDR